MTYPEHAYIKAGYQFEKARSTASAQDIARTIRLMIETESRTDRPHARQLVERGRQDARQTA
jgi:hypothetical protein